MRSRSSLRRLLAAAPLVTVLAGCGVGAEHAGAAITVADRAGALFTRESFGFHECSGVVLHTARRDLVATAAHCITGSGRGYSFAPGYADGYADGHVDGTAAGHAPFGAWKVRAVWIDPRWKRPRGTPAYDLAIVAVEPQKRGGKVVQLEDVVPGATLAHTAPAAGTAVTPVGYPLGKGGSTITCQTTTTLTGVSPTFACPGFIDGTSGGPWFTATTAAGAATGGPAPGSTLPVGETLRVAGLVSGLHQGGCTPEVSYAAPLGRWSDALLARAVARRPADTVPSPPGDGC
ncbi:MAG: trypsin-like serine protease [Solirubrobacteraceae bacterium]|nr:trypsin-like peptidase domain-containing protein [Patulibacter sp.]